MSGRFDAAAIERAVRDAFTAWREGAAAPEREVPPVTGRVIHFVERTAAVQSSLRIAIPVVSPSHPDYVPMMLMNTVLGRVVLVAHHPESAREAGLHIFAVRRHHGARR